MCARPADAPVLVGELKLRKSDEALWDVFKMIDAVVSCDVSGAYVIVGAGDRAWAQRGACQELFVRDLSRYASSSLFSDNPTAWLGLLKGGSGRPTTVPRTISTRLIAQEPLFIDEVTGSLRCIAVRSGDDERLAFKPRWCCGDWPVGVDAPDSYYRWKARH